MGNDDQSLVGRTLGEFTVREHLSSGGFGMVFRAEQPALRREAVVKVMHTQLRSSETGVQRFLREAQLASALDHPYAAHTYAFGAEPDGLLWIAMELVRGTPLDRMLETHGPIPLERFVPLLDAICEVIHTAHEQGIVHRDLKPANVMVLARAGRLLPKLLDFGIARTVGAPAEPAEGIDPSLADTAETTDEQVAGRLTQRGTVMGSPLYMAPEQWVDAGEADARTDQYSLGVVCYEALTGRPPFGAGSRMNVAMAHARKPPPPLGPGFPPALDAVIARAMAKRPQDRYPDVLQLAAAFRVASGVAAETPPLPRLTDEQRTAVLAHAPQPLAQAVAALDAARHAHQARDALWQVVRVAVRLIGVTALAAHGHVGAGTTPHSEINEVLRRLRRRALADSEWLELARQLCRPFESIRDAHPVPELVALLAGDTTALAALVELHATADESGGSDEQVRDLLARSIPLVARALGELAFLSDYRLVVPGESDAEIWMGERRADRPRLPLRGRSLVAGQPALTDSSGVPVLSLWPFVQLHAPSQGASDALFFFEGKGRRGARLVALPDAFEHDDDELWQTFGALVDDTQDAQHATSSEERSPFPGLAAFTRNDAAHFFGRERETESAINHLRSHPLLAVVGPSGSGKSSFVQAGIVPAVPEGWEVISARPGPAPLVTLTARLVAAGFDAGDLRAELREHPGALGTVLRARRHTTVLFIDQLEELFTLCDDAQERALYAEALMRAARSADDSVRVVVTLRDDFLLRANELPAFRSRLGQNLQLLSTPVDADLRRILVESVTRAGYEFDDPTLPDEMAAALAGTPGALALLSFTASKLWEVRDRKFRQLGKKAYASLGGVGGALAHHAEATLDAMPHEEQRLVREVFRHLVTAEGTRAVLSHREIEQVLGGGPHAGAVVEKLVAARLLVVSESEGGTERVEVAHETLLDAWPRLVGWRREDAEGARLRDQLRAAARQWEERHRPAGLLWRGDALAEYRLWRARYPGTLTHSEEAFASASLADVARTRRLRRLLLAAAFVLLGAGIVGLLLLNGRAERQRVHAEQSAAALQENLRRQYENQGRRLLLDGDPLQALSYLEKATSLGATGPAHDFLIASATSATEGEIFAVTHGGAINRVRFSPDGRWFATGGWDNAARLWDATTGALVHEWKHDSVVLEVGFSPDNSLLMTASWDGTAVLRDPASGATVQTLVHGAPIECATFSPDGAWILTVTASGVLRTWDPATGKERLRIETGGSPRYKGACAVSPDGTTIAMGDGKGSVRIWDSQSGRSLAQFAEHTDAVRVVAYSPDGALLATGGSDGKAVVTNLATARTLQTIVHRAAVWSVAWDPRGDRIATASADHTAAVWSVATGSREVELTDHAAGVNRIVYTPDGARLITISIDATVREWDAASGRAIARWFGHQSTVQDIALDAERGRFVTAGDDGMAFVWRMAGEERIRWLRGHRGVVHDARFSPDGRLVVTAGRDGAARLWEVETGRQLRMLVEGNPPFERAAFDPSGARVALVDTNGTISIWNTGTGARLLVIDDLHVTANGLAWAPDGRRVAVAADDGTMRIWSAETGESLLEVTSAEGRRALSVAFTPSGDAVVTTGEDNAIRFWDPSTGALLRSDPSPREQMLVAFDPTGDRAATITGRVIRIWQVRDGTTLATLVGHVGPPGVAVAWSPDGAFLVTGSIDGTARLWDSTTGDMLDVFPHATQVWAVDYSPDGRRVLSAADDGSVAIRELPKRTSSAE